MQLLLIDNDYRFVHSVRVKLSFKAVSCVAALGLGLSGCAAADESDRSGAAGRVSTDPAGSELGRAATRLVITHDGGVTVLDADTMDRLGDTETAGRTALEVVDDGRHVLFTEDRRVRVLDSGAWSESRSDRLHYFSRPPRVVGRALEGSEPGHVVAHGGSVAVFDEGSGRISVLEDAELDRADPEVRVVDRPPHHGFAVPLSGRRILTSVPGNADGERLGIATVEADGRESARYEQCPAIHGQTEVGSGGRFAFGCGDGVLTYNDGAKNVRKATSPAPNGRVSTVAGSPESEVVLGNYAVEGDNRAPTMVSLTDTTTGAMRLVDIGAEYHGLARGPHGEALVFATDGKLSVIDPNTGGITKRIDVLPPWAKPKDWRVPRPELAVTATAVFVTDPAKSTVVRVDPATGQVGRAHDIGVRPIEIVAVGAPKP